MCVRACVRRVRVRVFTRERACSRVRVRESARARVYLGERDLLTHMYTHVHARVYADAP